MGTVSPAAGKQCLIMYIIPNELYHAILRREFEELLLVLNWTKMDN